MLKSLAEYGITRLAHNFETLDDESSNLSQTPPILFVPLPLTKLRAHPIEPEFLELMKFRDYVPDGGTWSRPSHCARNAAMYLESCMRRFRPSLAEASARPDFMAVENLEPLWSVSSPPCILPAQPFLVRLGTRWTEMGNPKHHIPWAGRNALSRARGHHIRDEESSSPVDDMDMDDEDEMRKLEDTMSEEEWDQYDRIFPKEARFPALMTSYFGQQQGRVFYACMDSHRLVIRQSKTDFY
ncbi:hypothetical protein ATEIFO6365_0012014900 [Aspergillus terreus]|uniref:Uncharacterized protein n=1 Tax=Aspergillus terreus TaxID=33178 RepID=A0A5M3ZAP6_ASPTE|nr:hypothetical protein ATETN484_0013015900 [Aspergillus terreus]GFF20393.1 hypothetical protein ATEIFO6365_0012014900 [Aspergillus terreus]